MLIGVTSTWIALAFLFLLGSVFSQQTSKYGYVLIPIMAGLFSFFGWLDPNYLLMIIPLLISMGVITFMKEQFREKLGGYGSTGSFIWKVMIFMMLLQVSIVFVASIGIFGDAPAGLEANRFNQTTSKWTIEGTKDQFGQYTDTNGITQLAFLWSNVVQLFGFMFTMLFGIFAIYWVLTGTFHIPQQLAVVLSAIVYIMFIIELYILIVRPAKLPDT